MARATALTASLLGERSLRSASFIQAHGSSTPQNRVTESRIFNEVAKAFGISGWPVAAVKSYLGHSLGPASGDQLMNTLGIFARGIVPGIKTIDAVAEDVHAERLQISTEDQHLGIENCLVGLLNSKGFGGNNATAAVISPLAIEPLLKKRHGTQSWNTYLDRRSSTIESTAAYVRDADAGKLRPIYEFGTGVVDEEAIEMDSQELRIPGFRHAIRLGGCDGFDDLAN